MNNLRIILISFFITVFFFSCDKFEGNQEIPSYIRIKGFNVVENPNIDFSYIQTEGFLTNDICDVWAFVTDNKVQKPLGAYSLTKGTDLIVPVLAKGRKYIELRPGIKFNGMASTRGYYEFYTVWADTVELKEGEITDIEVKDVMYNQYATIAKCYMFEDTFNPMENADKIADIPNQFHIVSNDSVAYGNSYGSFYSSSAQDSYKIITKDSITCSNTAAMILELDYHSNIPFEIGLYGKQLQEGNNLYISTMMIKPNDNPSLQPNDKKQWQKMYIILGKTWSNLSYNPFKIWFAPQNNKNINNGFVHIDNMKIVHFPQ